MDNSMHRPYNPMPPGSLGDYTPPPYMDLNGGSGSFVDPPEDEEFMETKEYDNILSTLSTEKQMKQLEIIDKLQDLGIDHDSVDLPRLVVCGDQSSGKSSVLAAITGIPFPRQAGTCTRFVTQIILRHDANKFSSEVSIVPGIDREPSDQDRLKAVRQQVASDFSNLPEVINAAAASIFTQARQRNEFAEDVLRIEICGKDQQPLEILDLPGLINNDKRHGSDIRAVESIVKNHIQKRRSIVLVVVGADKDLRGHTILQTIEQTPGCRERSFGIITKPDVPRAQSLQTYLTLASNKTPGYEFEWGWHVLRSSTEVELTKKETPQIRDQREKDFFCTSEWRQLLRPPPYDSEEQILGILALRKRVRGLLFELNQKELPNVRRDIQKQLAAHGARLKELGGERNIVQMRERLTKGCTDLAHLARDHARGIYDARVPIGGVHDEDLLLRARIRDLSDVFNWTIHNFGHTYAPEHFALTTESDVNLPGHQAVNNATGTDAKPGGRAALFQPAKVVSQQEYYADGLKFLNKTRGEEPKGYYDPQRISPLFQKQSAKWENIAEHFLREFYDKCEVFLQHALRLEFRTEEDVPNRLRERFLDENMERRRINAEAELQRLLDDRKRPVNTQSPDFIVKTRHLRSARTFASFNNAVGNEEARRNNSRNGLSVLDADIVTRDLGVFTANQHEAAEAARINDDTLTYYIHARTMFVDNFLMQVIERHLLDDMSSLFKNVYILSDDDIEDILKEREDRSHERESLVLKIKRLKEANNILNN